MRIPVIVAAAFAGLSVAAPLTRRAVSSDVLQQLNLFAEYSAASYCTPNIDSTGEKLTCASGNCPTVERADTTTLSEFYEDTEFGDVAGFLAVDKTNQLLVLSFRGSRTFDTWIANLDFGLDAINLCTGCKAHGGFWKSWQVVANDVTASIQSAIARYPGYRIVFTGHSFGGAVATLGAAQLRKAGYAIDLYSYGSPRVGNDALARYITGQRSNYRVTHTNDIVPRLPPMLFGFSHSSPEYWITSGDGQKVTTADVQVIEGVGSRAGNAGQDKQSVPAHSWYMIDISACQ